MIGFLVFLLRFSRFLFLLDLLNAHKIEVFLGVLCVCVVGVENLS